MKIPETIEDIKALYEPDPLTSIFEGEAVYFQRIRVFLENVSAAEEGNAPEYLHCVDLLREYFSERRSRIRCEMDKSELA